MAAGGSLIESAKRDGVPYIQFPTVGIQPRAALGYGVMALAAFARDGALQQECAALVFGMTLLEESGRKHAQAVTGHIPLIYASVRNGAVAHNWKIKVNENAKVEELKKLLAETTKNVPAIKQKLEETNHVLHTATTKMYQKTQKAPKEGDTVDTEKAK